ncbi:MAG: OmpH family outer membrane protein [Candidatus Puniceispirillales bacterium]
MLSINVLILSSIINNNVTSSTIIQKNNSILNSSTNFLISNKSEIYKIGIVDFRYILKKSNAMKTLGNKFLLFERKINEKFKQKQIDLKKKEKTIREDKEKFTELDFKKKMKILKKDVFQVQKKYKSERSILNKSFQKIQKKIKDLLAQVIKDVSVEKNINVVFLKENIFLFNNPSIDLTSEVLDLFNKKTKSLRITISPSN